MRAAIFHNSSVLTDFFPMKGKVGIAVIKINDQLVILRIYPYLNTINSTAHSRYVRIETLLTNQLLTANCMVENLSGFVFEIVRLAADLATVITLLFIVLPFVKTIKTEQANGLKNAYESQSKQRWTVINNPQTLTIAAEAYGISAEQFIKDTIASDRINSVSWQYEFYIKKLTEADLWEHQIVDIQGLFAIPIIAERWEKVRSQYDEDFQQFIDEQILIDTD